VEVRSCGRTCPTSLLLEPVRYLRLRGGVALFTRTESGSGSGSGSGMGWSRLDPGVSRYGPLLACVWFVV
jgi:hypothetical protein